MNEAILSLFLEQNKCHIDSTDLPRIIFFLNYMDKHSLRLADIESDIFFFTNDAQTLSFSISELIAYVNAMKAGIAFPWNNYK